MGRIVGIIAGAVVDYLDRISRAWTDFWFSPRDPFCLCVIRCLVGWMAFYTTLVWGIELESFVFPHGYNSAEMVRNYLDTFEGPYALSFWFWVPVDWIYPVHYVCLAITFCFMIGLFSRTTSVLTLIILISYSYRARFSNYGLDQINAILVLYLCLAPCGAYLSVDRLLKRYRSITNNIMQQGVAIADRVKPTVTSGLATRLIQFHLCVIYLAAGTGKLFGESWWDGTAMWRSFANAEYQTFDLTFLAYYPWVTNFLTHMTVYWEISFAFLVWRPLTRPVVLVMGLGMHFGIGLFMGMWTFGTCMMFGYVTFVEPELVKAFFHEIKILVFGSQQTTVEVDRGSMADVKSVAWRKAIDGIDRLQVVVSGQPTSTAVNPPTRISTGTQSISTSAVVVLDLEAGSRQKTSQTLTQHGVPVLQAGSIDLLIEELERQPDLIPIVNLDGVSDLQAQDYLTSHLALNLAERPAVTLLRSHQLKWSDQSERLEFHKTIVLPCERDEIWRQYQRAIAAFTSHCTNSNSSNSDENSKFKDSVLY